MLDEGVEIDARVDPEHQKAERLPARAPVENRHEEADGKPSWYTRSDRVRECQLLRTHDFHGPSDV